MTHHLFRAPRHARGQIIAITRKPTLDRKTFETKRRAADAASSLPQHRRRGHRRGGAR